MADEITMGDLAIKLKTAGEQFDEASARSLARCAQLGVGHMKSAIQGVHAVKTSTMLNSVRPDRKSVSEYWIGPTVEYAPFVAFGTSRMQARPFHEIAARQLIRTCEQVFASAELVKGL